MHEWKRCGYPVEYSNRSTHILNLARALFILPFAEHNPIAAISTYMNTLGPSNQVCAQYVIRTPHMLTQSQIATLCEPENKSYLNEIEVIFSTYESKVVDSMADLSDCMKATIFTLICDISQCKSHYFYYSEPGTDR